METTKSYNFSFNLSPKFHLVENSPIYFLLQEMFFGSFLEISHHEEEL